jgi:hypothetical protein
MAQNMRAFLKLSIVLSFALAFAHGQAGVWDHVNTRPGPRPERVTVSKAQFEATKRALIAAGGTDAWPCDSTGENWTQALIFEDLPVSETEKTMLVEAGPGCARGGQGSNGAMWVVRFTDQKPLLLATPKQEFNGWLYSIQPTTNHGLRDLVLGWHMSAMETDLSYFQFDGKSYRLIGTAQLTADADGNARIVPDPKHN